MISMCEESYLIELELGECKSTFSLENAVCNHGFFMMAPNIWLPSTKTLQRPLRLSDNTKSVAVSISHPLNSSSLHIRINHHDLQLISNGVLSPEDHLAILRQVSRMLRMSAKDERDVKEFQSMNGEARRRGFGRLFRSPTLFEDAVKSILLCNCTWERTLKMAQALCELPSKLTNDCEQTITVKDLGGGESKRKQASHESNNVNKRAKDGEVAGNFPTAMEISHVNEGFLREKCNLGYRADKILKFARKIERGRFNITEFEESLDTKPYRQICKELKAIKGFGDFTVANILMCTGFYHDVPADTETIRHLKQVHGLENCSSSTIKKDVKKIYEKYAPYQCVAYWFELTSEFEKKLGKLSELDPSKYGTVSGSILSKPDTCNAMQCNAMNNK